MPAARPRSHPAGMFVVTEAEAAAIRAVYEQRGEFSAAVELRRLFPAITDTAQARACARTIAGWKPLPVPLRRGNRCSRDLDPDITRLLTRIHECRNGKPVGRAQAARRDRQLLTEASPRQVMLPGNGAANSALPRTEPRSLRTPFSFHRQELVRQLP